MRRSQIRLNLRQAFLATGKIAIFVCLASAINLAIAQDKATIVPPARVGKIFVSQASVLAEYDRFIPSFHGKKNNFPAEIRQKYLQKALKRAIEKELAYQECVRRQMEIADKEWSALVKEIEVRNNLLDKGGLKKYLQDQGQNYDQWVANLQRELLIEKLLKQEVEDKVTVDSKEIRDYYEKNLRAFYLSTAVQIQLISVVLDKKWDQAKQEAARQKAQKSWALAKKGSDFYQLASEHSEDPWRVKGGDFGLKHCGTLELAFEEKALSLKVNEISDVFQTNFGYHIMKLLDKKPGRQLPLAEVTDRIKISLLKEKKLSAMLQFYRNLAQKSPIIPQSASDLVLNPAND